jgi:CheY-like chemotaxis protein
MEKLVFIIDDDQVYLNFMKSHFRQMQGYVVETYPEGEDALQQLQSKNPSLIILDHNLSNAEKDGIYYLKKIKKLKPSVPTVYITASNEASLKQQAIKAGAASFITKSDAFLVQLRTALDEINSPKKKGLLGRLFK